MSHAPDPPSDGEQPGAPAPPATGAFAALSMAAAPAPPPERWPFALAGAALTAGIVFLVVVLVEVLGSGAAGRAAAPPQAPQIAVATPAPAAAPQLAPTASAPAPAPTVERADLRRFAANDRHHVRSTWVAGFYPIYEAAQEEFGVNWLLIAAVHKQETGFSTHPTTYRGLNFARCCAGPMQFNVTNGPVTTWERYRDSFKRADRPQSYNNATDRHPSVYDDFDAIMAAAALLRDSGAGPRLDASAWRAAYDYYGHDLTGVDYASQVLARAIGWGRGRFCINCETDPAMVTAVDAAWGAPVRAQLTEPAPAPRKRKRDAGEDRGPKAAVARAAAR